MQLIRIKFGHILPKKLIVKGAKIQELRIISFFKEEAVFFKKHEKN